MADPAFFPCAQCGADLRFAPGTHQLACNYCGHRNYIEVPPLEIVELDFRLALKDEIHTSETETTDISHCNSCGAEVNFEGETFARECIFCAAPIVEEAAKHRHFKAKGLLPFALTPDEARAALSKWLGERWFAPKGLKTYARDGGKIKGVYIPYWTFDAQTQTEYSGERGDVYYETRSVTVMTDRGPRQQMRRVPKVRWRRRRGRVQRFFDDVLVLASSSLPKGYTDRLGPWDLGGLVPFTPAYLAGFLSEAYTVDLQDGFAEARGVMDMIIHRDIRFDIGGDKQRIHTAETSFGEMHFKHILLPIYVAAYKYRGKTYRIVVNGRTGAVQGDRPYSSMKIFIAFVIGILVATLFFSLMSAGGGGSGGVPRY